MFTTVNLSCRFIYIIKNNLTNLYILNLILKLEINIEVCVKQHKKVAIKMLCNCHIKSVDKFVGKDITQL